MYPNEVKTIVDDFQKHYKNGNFEDAERCAHLLLNASIEAKVQTAVLSVMHVGCGKHRRDDNANKA